MTPQILFDGLSFPECPRWHNGHVWCVDGSNIWRARPGEPAGLFATLPCPLVLGIQFRGQELLAASAHARKIYRIDCAGRHSLLCDLSGVFDRPINEFVVHPNGSLYVGHMGFDPTKGEEPVASPLARVDPSGDISLQGSPLLFANGMLVLRDGGDLLVVESFAQRISRVPVLADGTLGPAQLYADLRGIDARPDGMCSDTDGNLWVTDMHFGQLLHVGQDGAIIGSIDLPWPLVTSCALGGKDGHTLFFTATAHMPDAQMTAHGSGLLGCVQVERPAAQLTPRRQARA